MGKYYSTGGSRIGKVGAEVYEIKNGTNIVRLKNSYIPVNNAWIKREDFKKYILSLLEVGIPQIYVLDELPEALYPYALLFVKNGEVRDIYVDKDFTRTKINIGSEEKYDAVDIVNEVPEEPRDNTVYFVNDDQVNKNKKENENLDCDIYVCDNNELRKVTIKDPDVDLIKEVIEEIKTKSLANVYNANLAINEIVSTDAEGKLKASGINSTTASTVVNGVNTKSLKNIYNTTLTADRLIYSDNNGCLAISDVTNTNAKSVIDGVKNKCLSAFYNANLTTNKILGSNNSGKLYATGIDITTTNNVVTGVSTKSLKNVYNETLTADRLIYSDSDGCLAVSNLAKSTTKTVVDAVTTKFLSSTYNTNLTANKILGSNGSGKLYATGIDTTTASNVINGISTKSFKNVYNTTITANKILCTDGSGIVTTTNKYTVASPLEMYSNKIELGQVFDTSGGLGHWMIGIDVYGRVSARRAVNMVEILGYINTDGGSVTVETPSNNCALFFLNTHGGNFYLAQICVNTNPSFRRVFEVLRTTSGYSLPRVTRNSDTNITITATNYCRAVIFTFNTRIT